ncbi:GlsB/YeaQ/YmgE family stress response membrane protein [Lapillicoccus sp.]|jgi:uncharacterized membrane protein YeaQ/YmgE (transglycosylase-associated protein family)|uniref:GlsB/YeaQ/YmgE family stress response membrane protein n=1 Tax=Lapillicoccus sp. TaxID=1909287 RepID=UPI0025DDA994|nr:GlsB/YeaQ/YmgE family stress response membrane protein [Lapillicoccus sp.]
MVGSLIGAIVVGAIIGALGRLILSGKQNISLLVTIVIGIISSVVVNLILGAMFHYTGGGGISWWFWIISALVAAGLIRLYGSMTSKKV